MKINTDALQGPAKAYRAAGAGAPAPARAAGQPVAPAPGGAADRVSVSERARLAAVARRAMEEVSPARAARLAELRAAVAAGTYSVPAADLAGRLLAAWGGP